MTQEEIRLMTELNNKFQKDCNHVSEYLKQVDSDFNYADHSWSLDGDCAENYGDIYSRGCFMETVFPNFDIELLTYSDKQLEEYVKNKQKEQEEEKRKQEEAEKERQHRIDLEMFKNLKEKLGL